jgi:uncharacterized membrane protein
MTKERIPKLPKPETIFEKITEATGSYTSIAIHTVIFIVFLLAPVFGWLDRDDALLILTTLVSLEAIYLALFIQMTVNRNTESLEKVEEDIDEIQEDVEDISEEVEDLGEDLDKIEKEIDEIQEDVEDLGEDLEEDNTEDKKQKQDQEARLDKIEKALEVLIKEIGSMRK